MTWTFNVQRVALRLAHRRLLAAIVIAAIGMPASALATTAWTVVLVGGPETTVSAVDESAEGVPLVNPLDLAPLLKLDLESLDVASLPGAQLRDGIVQVPLTELARLADRKVVIGAERRAFLFAIDKAPAPTTLNHATNWKPLTIEKTAAEIAETRRLDGTDSAASQQRRSAALLLPSAHEALRFSSGLGYVVGHDWATSWDASGTANGFTIASSTFLTTGTDGVRFMYGRGVVEAPNSIWSIEAGDVFGELRGLSRGLRATLTPRGRWSPSLALLLPVDDASLSPVAAYGDRLALNAHVELAVEATSDGSTFLRSTIAGTRGNVDAVFRHDRGRQTQDRSIGGSFMLWRGFGLLGAARVSHGRGAERDRWLRGGVTVGLGRFAQVTLDQTRSRVGASDSVAYSGSVHLPVGPVQVFQRYQASDSVYLDGAGADLSYRQVQSSASYSPTRRVHLTYHVGTQWQRGGEARQFNELHTAITLSSRTSVRLTSSVPDPLDPERLNARVTHDVSRRLNLSVEYGRVSPYQAATEGADANDRRLLLFVTRSFGVQTPARGGTVRGTVVSQLGDPITGAIVRLGPYSTETDAYGGYRFAHVPPGTHRLFLDAEHLPASYIPRNDAQDVAVRAGDVLERDLAAFELGAITGRVYVDRNGNGTMDSNEGLPGAVLFMNDRAVVSDARGQFTFHDVSPGLHRVQLDTTRLRGDVVKPAVDTADVDVGLGPNDPINFRVLPKVTPIRMQEWPR